MAPRPKIQPPANIERKAPATQDHRNLPMRAKGDNARVERRIIPHDTWVGGILIDTTTTYHEDGTPNCRYTFEVTNPKLYVGTTLSFNMNEKMTLSLDASEPKSLQSKFPGVDLCDEGSVWNALQGLPLRIHVGHREYVDTLTGEAKIGYRVSGFAVDDRARV